MDPRALDTGHLALFVGMRVNALVLTRLARQGFADIKESDGYVVQHLVEGPRTISELARRMGVTQQAASKSVESLRRRKLVTVTASADSRAKDVALAARGLAVVTRARRARRAIELRLATTCGRHELDVTRTALLAMLQELGGMPAVKARRVREPGG